MICNKCGKRNPDDAKFCEECGASVEYFEEESQKGRAFLTVIIVCIVAAIALLIGIIWGMNQKM